MSDCGCNSNTHAPGCYGRGRIKEQVLYPVLDNDCTGNSSVSGSCPEGFQPFSRAILGSGCITIPAIGGTFNLPVCDASQWVIGMWVQGPAIGTYPVVGVNAATNLLTLRNSCSDGTTAIAGNPEPGTQVCGDFPIWLGRVDPCLDAASFCLQTFACLESISEDNPLCLENIVTTTTGQCVRMLGLSAACDSGDCPQPDDPNCLTKLDTVRFCEKTIVFDDGLEEAETDGSICYAPVVISEDGALAKSTQGNLMYFLQIKMEDRTISNQNSAGMASGMTFSMNPTSFGVPDCAKGVCLRCFYTFDHDDGDQLAFNTYIRGADQAINSQDRLIISIVTGTSSSDQADSEAFSTIVMFGASSKLIYHELQPVNIQGNNNSMRCYIAIEAYLQ